MRIKGTEGVVGRIGRLFGQDKRHYSSQDADANAICKSVNQTSRQAGEFGSWQPSEAVSTNWLGLSLGLGLGITRSTVRPGARVWTLRVGIDREWVNQG